MGTTFWGLSATAWTAIYTLLTAGLLTIAVVAAFYAARQWRASKQQIADSRLAQLEASRPYVIVTVEPSGASRVLFDLSVRNIGRRPAMKVRVQIDPPPTRARELTDDFPIAKIKMLSEPIAMIAPGQDMRAFWDSHIERNGREELPKAHLVTLTYEDTSGHKYGPEKSVIDLDAMRGTLYTSVKTIHDIGQTLDKMHEVIKASSMLGGNGSLEVAAVVEGWDEHEARRDRESYDMMCRNLEALKSLHPDAPQIATLEKSIAQWRQDHPDDFAARSDQNASTGACLNAGQLWQVLRHALRRRQERERGQTG